MTGLLLSNLCENIVKKSIWKFIDIFQNQVLNFLNIFTAHGKITAGYTNSLDRILLLLCGNVIGRVTIIFTNDRLLSLCLSLFFYDLLFLSGY